MAVARGLLFFSRGLACLGGGGRFGAFSLLSRRRLSLTLSNSLAQPQNERDYICAMLFCQRKKPLAGYISQVICLFDALSRIRIVVLRETREEHTNDKVKRFHGCATLLARET